MNQRNNVESNQEPSFLFQNGGKAPGLVSPGKTYKDPKKYTVLKIIIAHRANL